MPLSPSEPGASRRGESGNHPLLPTPRTIDRAGAAPQGGVRRYGEPELARVRFIKSAQRLGFSLDEVTELLKLEDGSHCGQAREQGEKKLADVRARLADLQRIEQALSELVERCRSARGRVCCPLIASLQNWPVATNQLRTVAARRC